jgi:malate/lactate dehydrogenase
MDIEKELLEIKDLLDSTCLIEAVRKEVHSVLKNHKAFVIGGKHAEDKLAGSSEYDVVIIHNDGEEASEDITRRIRANISNIEVEKFKNLIDNVIGIKTARRRRFDGQQDDCKNC